MADNKPTTEILMATLAGLANDASVNILGPDYPNGWVTLQSIERGASSVIPAVQGFLAHGPIDPSDPISEVIQTLVLGIDWANFFKDYKTSTNRQSQLSNKISETTIPFAKTGYLAQSAYERVRSEIWEAVTKYKGSERLFICGMGLGAQLAQLAALDLRPSTSHLGPGGQRPPSVQPLCYAFSAPNTSNAIMVDYYNESTVSSDETIATNTYMAGTYDPFKLVDFLPVAPDDEEFGILGNPLGIPSDIPDIDVPWLERSSLFYVQQLGGNLPIGPAIESTFNYSPPGFNLGLAFTFCNLVAEAYHQSQHPGMTGIVTPGYTFVASVNSNGSPYAYLFQGGFFLVVAIRGPITWEETITVSTDSSQIPSVVVPRSRVHGGVGKLYNTSTTEIGGDELFKDALEAAIRANIGNRKLVFTGHGIGGAIANLAATDYTLNRGADLTLESVYTFGASALGNGLFRDTFDENLGAICYQVRRIYDEISKALFGQRSVYRELSNSVVMNGILPDDERTYHSISGYLKLLNTGTSSKVAFDPKLNKLELRKRKIRRNFCN